MFTAPPTFGAFRVLHQIGSGVLGPVFRTYDPQRDRLVAVKAFRLDIVPEQVARLAEALRRLVSSPLNHPNLVPALDAGLEGTTAYLASEYVTAETLDVALRHLAPAPLERVEPMISQMADAIDAAWASGVGHGALHPRDVFVTVDTNEVRVSGFGVVPALESIGIKTPVRRPYAAPERLADDDWDIRADVYTLGAIAHELLTRRRPAGPDQQDGTLTTGTSAEQRVLIRRVLTAALAERPEHRFASARAFADALGAIVRGEPIGALPEVVLPVPGGPLDLGDFGLATATEAGLSNSESRIPNSEFEEPGPVLVAGDVPPVMDPRPPPASVETDEPASSREPGVMDEPPIAGDPETSAKVTRVEPGPVPFAGDLFGHVEPPSAATFTWVALVAVGVACVMVGLVLGFLWGRRPAVLPPAMPALAAGRPGEVGTDVPVAPVPPPGADKAAAAASSEKEPAQNRDGKPAATGAQATTGPGRIVVRSMPSGAMLLIDGRPHGQTPATVKDLSLGAHTIEIARPGYVPHSERVMLSARSMARSLSVTLHAGQGSGAAAAGTAAAGTAASLLGSIYVDSRPRGARVMMDGRVVGTSPLRIPELRPGSHDVQVDLAGHRPFTARVTLKASEQARVTAVLEERKQF